MGMLSWDGEGFFAHLTDICSQRLDVAADAVAQNMRDLIDTPYPPASSPGNAPHRRTGNLKAKIKVFRPSPLVRKIGSTAPYAIFLELGTSKMAARPFGLRALMRSAGQIRQVVAAGNLAAVA